MGRDQSNIIGDNYGADPDQQLLNDRLLRSYIP
jgi:hypothetical protein